MRPIRMLVQLRGGTVSLRTWSDRQTDALTLDLITVSATLIELHDGAWEDADADAVAEQVWVSFWRLVRASLDGVELPERTTFADRMTLLDAMWRLNELDDLEGPAGKWAALEAAIRRSRTILQGHLSSANPGTTG